MNPDKEQLLQELLHEKLGELMHYKGTSRCYELDTAYNRLINATYDLIEAKLPLALTGVNNTRKQPFFDWKSIKMDDKDLIDKPKQGRIKII